MADAKWTRVDVADRPKKGDPDYVNHVMSWDSTLTAN